MSHWFIAQPDVNVCISAVFITQCSQTAAGCCATLRWLGGNDFSELLHMVFITHMSIQSSDVGEPLGDSDCKPLQNIKMEKPNPSKFDIGNKWNQNTWAIVSLYRIFFLKNGTHSCNKTQMLKGKKHFFECIEQTVSYHLWMCFSFLCILKVHLEEGIANYPGLE